MLQLLVIFSLVCAVVWIKYLHMPRVSFSRRLCYISRLWGTSSFGTDIYMSLLYLVIVAGHYIDSMSYRPTAVSECCLLSYVNTYMLLRLTARASKDGIACRAVVLAQMRGRHAFPSLERPKLTPPVSLNQACHNWVCRRGQSLGLIGRNRPHGVRSVNRRNILSNNFILLFSLRPSLHPGLYMVQWFIKIWSHRCDTKFKLHRLCLV